MNTGEFFDKVESLYKDWQYDHPRVLYSMIKLLKPKVVVEVGTFIGYGACYMARALEENGAGELYCIDNWQLPNPSWRKEPVKSTFINSLNALGLIGRVTLIEGDSDKVQWPEKADMVYIDGWHSYKMVHSDWGRAVKTGARVICLDDAISVYGPRMLVKDIMQDADQAWGVSLLASAAGMAICTRHRDFYGKPVTFSQELPNHPGTDIKSPEDLAKHLNEL